MSRFRKAGVSLVVALALVGGVRLIGIMSGLLPRLHAQAFSGASGTSSDDYESTSVDGEPLNPLNGQDLARDKFELSQTDLQDLARAQKDLARALLEESNISYDSRMKEFMAGRGTLDFLIGSALRLLDSERALATSDAEQIAALERHWQRIRLMDRINQYRYEAGRIPIQDYSESRYYRLQAEMWLIEALRKANKK